MRKVLVCLFALSLLTVACSKDANQSEGSTQSTPAADTVATDSTAKDTTLHGEVITNANLSAGVKFQLVTDSTRDTVNVSDLFTAIIAVPAKKVEITGTYSVNAKTSMKWISPSICKPDSCKATSTKNN